MKRNFNEWLSTMKESIASWTYYTDFEKVYDNVKLIRIPSAGHGFDGKDSQFAREQSIEFIKKNLK